MNVIDAKRLEAKSKREYGEEMFALQLRAHKLPEAQRQYRFHDERKWLLDFSWPDRKIALEVEGGIWLAKGAHNTGTAITRDIEKYNTALSMGWSVYRVTIEMVVNGEALEWISQALGASA